MRRFWLVFASPAIRITIEYVLFKKFRIIAPFEVVLLLIVVLISVAEWASIKLVIQDGKIIFYKGIIIKSVKTVQLSRVIGVCARQSLLDMVRSCVGFALVTESGTNNKNKSDIKLKTSDYRALCGGVYASMVESPLKPMFLFKRLAKNSVWICTASISVGLIGFYVFEITIWSWLALTAVFASYYVAINIYNRKKGFVCFGEHLHVEGCGLFRYKRLCCDKKDVGLLKVMQTPADRRDNSCKIKIILGGESGERVKIKYISFTNAKKEITNFLTQ